MRQRQLYLSQRAFIVSEINGITTFFYLPPNITSGAMSFVSPKRKSGRLFLCNVNEMIVVRFNLDQKNDLKKLISPKVYSRFN